MTQRLYYTDPGLAEFDAAVISLEVVDGRQMVRLDRTAFYPTSGGQPFDLGTLGNARVIDVLDEENGDVIHVVEGALAVGDTVAGRIDWNRRFDHMQQHTGQHVLSAAFDRLFGVRTESFHMGAAASSIDLARAVSATELAQAEDEANRIVWEDRMVHIRFASAEEAAALPLRKESLRTGPLRLIDVENFDLSACGGTHVARTGAIGIIAIGGAEKFRGGSRVEFLCGGRALDRFRLWRDTLAATQLHLSVAPEDMAAAIERMQADAKAQQKIQRGMQDKLAAHEAQGLIAKGTRAGARLVIVGAIEGWDAQGLKAMAVAAAAIDPTAAIALFTTTSPALAVIAKGANGGIDAGAVLKALVAKFGGKGGGKPDLAQGGGLSAPSAELIAKARAMLGV